MKLFSEDVIGTLLGNMYSKYCKVLPAKSKKDSTRCETVYRILSTDLNNKSTSFYSRNNNKNKQRYIYMISRSNAQRE